MVWSIPNLLTVGRLLAAPAIALIYLVLDRPLADWAAFAIFLVASGTDYVDGALARRWQQVSKFGAMADPIADKAMVITALMVVLGHSNMNPWLILPASVIVFREIFVSGLREYLGAKASKLSVTKLAKWKTTVQMIAISVLFVGLALDQTHLRFYATHTPEEYQAMVDSGPQGGSWVWWAMEYAASVWWSGVILLWVSGILTAITGWDYFSKARPYLADEQ